MQFEPIDEGPFSDEDRAKMRDALKARIDDLLLENRGLRTARHMMTAADEIAADLRLEWVGTPEEKQAEMEDMLNQVDQVSTG